MTSTQIRKLRWFVAPFMALFSAAFSLLPFWLALLFPTGEFADNFLALSEGEKVSLSIFTAVAVTAMMVIAATSMWVCMETVALRHEKQEFSQVGASR